MDFPEDLEFCQVLVNLMPHLVKSRDATQTLTEELKQCSTINWGNIRFLLSELHECILQNIGVYYSPNRNKFINFIFRFLTIFDTHKCSDLSVIADVLELLCLIIEDCTGDNTKAISMGNPINNNNGKNYISTFEMTLVTPYKDIPSCMEERQWDYSISENRNWVETFTYLGRFDILKALISFGVTLSLPQDVRDEYYCLIGTMTRLFEIESLVEERRYEQYLLHNLRSDFDECSRKRLIFINKVMRILFANYFHTATDKYIQCARIYVESTLEPLITSEEIKSSITKLCSGVMCEEKLQQFLEKYETYFPESREDSTPRSLKHLSRFQVRECLRTARKFPYGVESLYLPNPIKDYIRFRDILF